MAAKNSRITNKTNNSVLSKNKKVCQNIFCKARGLMFTRQKKDFGLIFIFPEEDRVNTTATMFFMFYQIDILWLDKNKRIVDLKKNAKPFTISIIPKKKAMYVIELPAGTIHKTKTKLNDRIDF